MDENLLKINNILCFYVFNKKSKEYKYSFINKDINKDKIEYFINNLNTNFNNINYLTKKYFQVGVGNWYLYNLKSDEFYLLLLVKFDFSEKIAEQLMINIKKVIILNEKDQNDWNEKIENKLYKYNDLEYSIEESIVFKEKNIKKNKMYKLQYNIVTNEINNKEISNKRKLFLFSISFLLLLCLYYPFRL